ncbi:MAG: acylphosphatase [Candidatus Omnitrophota bacterium]|nr:acylphosphatase [Candidatus Omnitrophota bacterium]
MKKQLHLYYSGKVQGIGFRYAVQDIASGLKICGWVKNLIDGRVEVLAQAEEDTLGGFLEQVKRNFSRYIKEVNVQWEPACRQDGEFRDFQVQF